MGTEPPTSVITGRQTDCPSGKTASAGRLRLQLSRRILILPESRSGTSGVYPHASAGLPVFGSSVLTNLATAMTGMLAHYLESSPEG